MRLLQLSVLVAFIFVLFASGCATAQREGTLLSGDNAPVGSVYELGVYVVSKGDTVGKICVQFQISIRDFEAINPELNPLRLRIGQTVRIYEKLKQ